MARPIFIAIAVTVFLASVPPSFAQQGGGLKIMEPEEEGSCRDETGGEDAVQMRQKQMAVLKEMTAMLKRMSAIQQKMSRGVSPAEGRELGRELSQMTEATERMLSDLRGMGESPKKNPR